MDKIQLRKYLKAKRQILTNLEREHAAQAATKQFLESSLYLSNTNFSVYIATEQELNLHALIETLWETEKKVFLPSLVNNSDKQMQFKPYTKHSTLKTNRYNILEPITEEILPITELDVVLLPLIGFDLEGFRIGTGGGYYDATFSFLQINPRPLKPQLIGVGFETQCVDEIPHDEWDVVLDGVLTDQRLIFF